MSEVETETNNEKKIPVVEMFGPTLQGEGAHAGRQTFFIRFGLCDYKCAMCDSMHAVDPMQVKANATWMTQSEIYHKMAQLMIKSGSDCRWVTFSGGNPCIHDLTDLICSFEANGVNINIETQGTKVFPGINYADTITVSPKGPGMGENFDPKVYREFIESCNRHKVIVKIPVFHTMDLQFAKDVFKLSEDLGLRNFFLSLGNPYYDMKENEISNKELRNELLDQYKILAEEVLQDPAFSNVCFLPQLHVLTWANKLGV